LSILKEAVAEHPFEMQLILLAQTLSFEEGKLSEAHRYADLGLKVDPNNYTLLLGKFLLEAQSENFTAAFEYINRAIDSNPRDYRGWMFRSQLHLGTQKYDEAIRDAVTAVKHLPSDVSADERNLVLWGKWTAYISQQLEEKKDVDAAIKLLDKAIQECPTVLEAIIYQSQLYFQKEDPTSALKTIDKGLKNSPGNPFLLVLKANIYLSMENYVEVRKITDGLLKQNPKDYIALAIRGAVLARTGNREDAKKDYDLSKKVARESNISKEDAQAVSVYWQDVEQKLSLRKW